MPLPEIGKKAPNFSGFVSEDKKLALNSLEGQFVVVYFYPKDDTPGCTKEAQEFTENLAKFKQLRTTVIGISRDPIRKHLSFKSKYALAFELISDEDEKICKAYDVIKMKNMYGKQVRGIERSTFIIDPDSKIAAIWRKVKVPGHVDDVLNKLKELQAD